MLCDGSPCTGTIEFVFIVVVHANIPRHQPLLAIRLHPERLAVLGIAHPATIEFTDLQRHGNHPPRPVTSSTQPFRSALFSARPADVVVPLFTPHRAQLRVHAVLLETGRDYTSIRTRTVFAQHSLAPLRCVSSSVAAPHLSAAAINCNSSLSRQDLLPIANPMSAHRNPREKALRVCGSAVAAALC